MAGVRSMTLEDAREELGLGINFTKRDVSVAFAAIALESHADKAGNDTHRERLQKAIEAKKFLNEYLKGETPGKRVSDLIEKISKCIDKASPEEQVILKALSDRAFALRNEADITEEKIKDLKAEVSRVVDPIEAAFKKAKEDRAAGKAGERDKKQQQKDKEQQDKANNESNKQKSSSQQKENAEKDDAESKKQDQSSSEQKSKNAEQTEEQRAENARKQREFDLYIRRKGFVRTGNKKSHLFEMTEKDAGLCCGLGAGELNKEMRGKLPDGFYTKIRDWMYKDTNLHVKDGVVSCAPGSDENDPKTIRAMLKLSKLQGDPIVFSAKNPKWVSAAQIRAAIKAADGLQVKLNFSALEQHPELGMRDNGSLLFGGERSEQSEILRLIAKYNQRVAGKDYAPEEKPTQPDPKTYYKRDTERSPSTSPMSSRRNSFSENSQPGGLHAERAKWEKEESSSRYGYNHFASSNSGLGSEAHASFEMHDDGPETDLENDFDHEEQTELRPSRQESKAEEKDESESNHYVYHKDELYDDLLQVGKELEEIIKDGFPESKDDVEETSDALKEILTRGDELVKRAEGNQDDFVKNMKTLVKDLMKQASDMFSDPKDLHVRYTMSRYTMRRP